MNQNIEKTRNSSLSSLVGRNYFWLLALAAGLTAIYLTLVWRADDTAHLGMSGLFLLAVGSLLWDRRSNLSFTGNRTSTLVGTVLVGVVLWASNFLVNSDALSKSSGNLEFYLLRLSPFFAALGVALLASKFQQVKQFWRELVIIFFMGAPSVIAISLTDISPITAKFSTFLLWYTGFNVVLQDTYIYVALNEAAQGVVEVYEGCSGIEAMTYLLGLSVVCLVMFPIARFKRFFIPLIAVTIGFVINAIRVALMAVLSASGDRSAFDYWHEGDGSLLFGLFSVLAFGGLYMVLLHLEEMNQNRSNIPEPEELLL